MLGGGDRWPGRVGGEVADGGLDRRPAEVDAVHERRATCCRVDAEPARAAEDVEHPGVAGQPRREGMVGSLVEIKPGLLPAK